MKRSKYIRGFTLPELLLVMGIFATLTGMITLNLVKTQRTTSMHAITGFLTADFRSQQIKAMTGDTEGRSDSDSYGIYFATDSHTLFHGMVFNPLDSANFTVQLDPQYQYSPVGKTVVFEKISGNVATYSAVANTVVIQDTSNGDQKTLQFNKYGAIVAIN